MENNQTGAVNQAEFPRGLSWDRYCSRCLSAMYHAGIMNNLTSMFADDTKLYITLTYDNNSPHSLQEDLTKLQEWSIKMQINFHPDKCHVLHLGLSNTQNIYHMNNARGKIHMLDAVTSEKDPGVPIDQQLEFSDHIENAVKKANRVLDI